MKVPWSREDKYRKFLRMTSSMTSKRPSAYRVCQSNAVGRGLAPLDAQYLCKFIEHVPVTLALHRRSVAAKRGDWAVTEIS